MVNFGLVSFTLAFWRFHYVGGVLHGFAVWYLFLLDIIGVGVSAWWGQSVFYVEAYRLHGFLRIVNVFGMDN